MKRLHFNSTLNHKRDGYNTYYVSVEKVVTLYGNEFLRLKNDTLDDNYWIARYHKLMRIDINDIAHCVLFVDSESGDGILVDSEGAKYARKSQFIPNARALIENNELTEAERRIHERPKEITADIAEKTRCGESRFEPEEVLTKIITDDLRSNIMQAVIEMLRERDDIQSAEMIGQSVKAEAKPTHSLKLYCPLVVINEDCDEISCEFAVGCADEINEFIQEFSLPEEERRGLMAYYDKETSVCEKVYSAFPSVGEVNGELMGIFDCQISGELTDSELEELRGYLKGQASDGWGEGLEQREIETGKLGNICVSFFNNGASWSLHTEEEMEISRNEEPEMNLKM